ncbi:MAG: hypothetical protein H6R04_219 [Burkholderiaceae bacterium]|nr:hypothetical protein [Burkholderiaceae bacterium]
MTYKYYKHARLLTAGLTVLLLSSCATKQQSLYYWGDFQTQQYAYFKNEKGTEDSIQRLEKIREDAKANGKPVPPGLQAHLGMLYGQAGQTDKFERHLEAEKQQFPECTSYLDFLLKKNQKSKATP